MIQRLLASVALALIGVGLLATPAQATTPSVVYVSYAGVTNTYDRLAISEALFRVDQYTGSTFSLSNHICQAGEKCIAFYSSSLSGYGQCGLPADQRAAACVSIAYSGWNLAPGVTGFNVTLYQPFRDADYTKKVKAAMHELGHTMGIWTYLGSTYTHNTTPGTLMYPGIYSWTTYTFLPYEQGVLAAH